MKIRELKAVKDALSDLDGVRWRWPLLVSKGLVRKKAVFYSTQWGRERNAESDFVERFSLASAIYLDLVDRMGREKAFAAMRRILVPIGCSEQWAHLRSLGDVAETPMGRLMAFHNLMDKRGAPQFNQREYFELSESVCHFAIKRCVFHDFFTQAGTPELTRLFCEVDRDFFGAAFPELSFHRGDSWQNTIAYGRGFCTFIFEKPFPAQPDKRTSAIVAH
ncbi:MAG: L-2-amino-thiazoline-4-carboxylic acid hydrolase [Dehalococcoidia bacterium]|nr:L-2-amino-thiazoline-4-carboxylic acid hydrolase [Dehalococcoidia bacterium]